MRHRHEQRGRHEQHDQALDDERQVGRQLRVEDRRVEVAHGRAVEQRAEQQRAPGPCRTRCCGRAARPRSRSSRPARSWMSFVAMRNCQPSTSSAPARPASRPQIEHHLDVVAARADAGVLRGVRVEADRAHLVAGDRAVQQHPEQDRHREGDEDADVQALQLGVAPEHRQPRALEHVVGDRDRRRGLVVAVQRAAEAEQVGADVDGGVVEHDRRDHLVGPGRRLQHAGDARPDGAGGAGGDHRDHDVQERRRARPARSRRRPRRTSRRGTGPARRC